MLIDPKKSYQPALLKNVRSIVTIHNRPSGKLKSYHGDKEVAKKLMPGGEFLNLRLSDHLIHFGRELFGFINEKCLSC